MCNVKKMTKVLIKQGHPIIITILLHFFKNVKILTKLGFLYFFNIIYVLYSAINTQ